MRINNTTTWRPEPAASRGWWQAALWIPVGFAATRIVGEGAPLLAVVFLMAALAGVHRIVPGLVEFFVGIGGLLLSVFAAADGESCGAVLGDSGAGAVQVFGGVMLLSGLIRLLGTWRPAEMARHLLVATAALELGLFAVSPVGRVATTAQGRFTLPAVLLTTMFVTTLIGLRASFGIPLLGVGLVVAQGVLILTGSPCAVSPVVALAGSMTFAGAALFLGRDDEYLTPDDVWSNHTPHPA